MKSTPTTGGCNPLYVSEGLLHPCAGAEEYGCEVAWACTMEDGACEGASRCSDCLSADRWYLQGIRLLRFLCEAQVDE